MSLIHWWQLNGDLKDYGTNPIDLTNNGATIDNSGKIGKCYYFNGSNASLQYTGGPVVNGIFSVTMWVKSNSSTATQCLFCNRGSVSGEGPAIFIISGQTIRFDTVNITCNCAYPTDLNWHHIACVYSGTKRYIYIDGELKANLNTTSLGTTSNYFTIGGSGAASIATTNWLNGRLNDIRIYDHALSQKEVKEISKGLVLDYNFENDVVSSGKIYDNSGYGNNGTIYSGVDLGSNSPVGQQYCHIPELSTIICPTTNFNRTDELTYSIYFRHYGQGSASWTWLFTNGRADGTGYGYGAQITNDTTINCFWGNRTIQGVTIPKNEWHLLTVSIKGLTQNLYVDGVYQKSGTASSLPDYTNGVGLGLGCFYYSGGQIYKSECDIADFKIYAIALSADDIKLEYQRKASIDKNGNLFSPEFIEDNINIKITNTQITKARVLQEGNSKVQIFGGYTELEYLQSSGTQYIDTGFKPTSSTTVEADIYTISTNNKNWFGSEVNTTSSFVFNAMSSILVEYKYGNVDWTNVSYSTIVNKKCHISFGANGLIIDGNVLVNQMATNTFTCSSNLYIYTRYNKTDGMVSGRVYSFKVFENDTLVRNFIPAKRNKDNVLGMYDTVEHKFYTNSGTGTFTGGTELGQLSLISTNQVKEV